MQRMRSVGRDTAQLTDEERIYIDNRIVEAVRPKLIGRQLFPIFDVDPGDITYRGYKQTDMGPATISLHGQTMGRDRSVRTKYDITVPVLHKEFLIFWRDLMASRNAPGGRPINTMDAESAAYKVGVEEDTLLLTGEYTGWRAYGVEGLATATGRNIKASAGAWPANCITDAAAAIGELEADQHQGPYACVLNTTFFGKLRALIPNTAVMWMTPFSVLFQAGVFVSDCLKTSGGLSTNGLVVEPLKQNIEMARGLDMQVYEKQDDDMNLKTKVFEIVAPVVHRPTAICEMTGLT